MELLSLNIEKILLFFEEDTPEYNNTGDVTAMEVDFESEDAKKRMASRMSRFGGPPKPKAVTFEA